MIEVHKQPYLSPTGLTYTYAIKINGKRFAVMNGKEYAEFIIQEVIKHGKRNL